MTALETPQGPRPPVGSLNDFFEKGTGHENLYIEVAIKEDGKVVLFHNRAPKAPVSWFEFELGTGKLDFVLDDGAVRDIGLPLRQAVTKHMQNAHQILMVWMDDKTGEVKEGHYVPLVVRRD